MEFFKNLQWFLIYQTLKFCFLATSGAIAQVKNSLKSIKNGYFLSKIIKQSINLYVLKGEEFKNAVKIATYALRNKLSLHFGFILSSTLT